METPKMTKLQGLIKRKLEKETEETPPKQVKEKI